VPQGRRILPAQADPGLPALVVRSHYGDHSRGQPGRTGQPGSLVIGQAGWLVIGQPGRLVIGQPVRCVSRG
jgi:hypothetical protein